LASDQITIDNEKILEAAELYEQLAWVYDDTAEAIGDAGRFRDDSFGEPLRTAWDDLYTFLYNCAYETATNLRAYKQTLQTIVEENELTETAIEQHFEELQDQLFGEGYERSSVQAEEGDIDDLEAAQDVEALRHGGEYNAALDPDGAYGNHVTT
jgi:hypothetical protein